ncbi:Cytochrome c oxidase assembly protein COX11, mitochondrial [Halotydeus destructor]|nr:Cytochrome c oxidase assembly protein COX11, mitochondrial [Halotydeus destructor]
MFARGLISNIQLCVCYRHVQITTRSLNPSLLHHGSIDISFLRCANRGMSRFRPTPKKGYNRDAVLYSTAAVLMTLGLSYAAVPLYRIYCQSTGKGGRAAVDDSAAKIEAMKPNKKRIITVTFEADTESQMAWRFRPTQPEIKVSPGETALAFYTAMNPLDRPIDGVATYSINPFEAGAYFNKIQCFCFEEQRLNPKEEVDMPVFFYIDPDFATDPRLENVDKIALSYVFFESKEGANIPFLNLMKAQNQKNDVKLLA